MPRLLQLDSSADLSGSRTRAVTRSFADAWTSRGGDWTVVHRDLHRAPLPHLADADLHWAPRLRGEAADPPAAAAALQQELIDELLAADVLLVGAPMYNHSLPSALKAWLDHVHVPGLTSPFDEPTQPLAGRPAVVVASHGMAYDAGTPTAGQDHGVPVLELVLGGAMGMTVTSLVTRYAIAGRIPQLAAQAAQGEAEFDALLVEAAELARRLPGDSTPA
ncbi:FMN-dependent NADH-azoreductase [Blastococcus sp. SYSU D00695]